MSQPAINSMLIVARNTEQVDQVFEALDLDMSAELRDELSTMETDTIIDGLRRVQ